MMEMDAKFLAFAESLEQVATVGGFLAGEVERAESLTEDLKNKARELKKLAWEAGRKFRELSPEQQKEWLAS